MRPLAAALAGSTSATVQVRVDDLAECFTMTYGEVTADMGSFFRATR